MVRGARQMRVGYLIGALCTGGSERQLSELAVGMVARGHDVQVACYDGEGVFDAYVEDGGAGVLRSSGRTKLEKIRTIRRWIATFKPDIVHGFMKRASTLAVLANLPRRRCKVVASDLSTATFARHKPDLWVSLALWLFADRVATQTETNRRSLLLLAPWLRNKVAVIRNGVDTARFSPVARRESDVRFRFLVVGTVYRVKNPIRLVEAVQLLTRGGQRPFFLKWIGPKGQAGKESDEYLMASSLLKRYGLEDVMSFSGPRARMEEEYGWADCLVHVSHQEGMPNAVVEAMACGLPVVVSRVSDLPLVAAEARNGFVCDAKDASSIADAMAKVMALDEEELRRMAERSRDLAVRWFDRHLLVQRYEELYRELVPNIE